VPRRLLALRVPLSGLAVLAFAATAAPARGEPRDPAPSAAERVIDVRVAQRDQADASGAQTGLAARSPRTAARVDGARDRLTDTLGRQGVLDVDALTGSVRQLTRLDGALTDPTGAAPATVARDFARDHATALGLDAQDVDALTVAGQDRSTSGLTVVRFGQEVDGIPSFDSGLRVALDRAGRVISVAGAPRSDLPADVPATPPLSAADALRRLMDETGIHRSDVTVSSTANDARNTTRFSTGDVARLTLFGARGVRLAWHLTYRATSTLWYDAVVDATTGEVLYRTNLVKFAATANVYDNYPGAPVGGTQTPFDLTPYLTTPSATRLIGPNVHAWADVDDDDAAQPGEEVVPGAYTASTDNSRASGACDATHLCTWNHSPGTNWTVNRNQNVTQTFYYANKYHDHLANGAIGFTVASGNFEGSDPLDLNALDGAATAGGVPDINHINNANMATPPDGQSPRMQMYLFARSSSPSATQNFRDINGGDDAAVLYHEYTHGLSSRLVTNDDGTQALNSPQAGAMGEAWSDWYAQDFLVRDGQQADTPATDGDIDMGRYTDSIPHSIRHQAIDCAVGSANATACPGNARTPVGGYTFGDFGRIAGRPEVHADGEIWVQTLWQLRQGLVAKFGSDAAGADAAERIITDAMRLSIPEPSFLDMRNAILAADLNYSGGANRALIWETFRSRGMGFYAGADDGSDTAPIEDFTAPPAAGTPRGAITGTVTDRDTGAALPGTVAAIGGLATDPSFETYLAGTADASGRYTIPGVPPGTYPKVGFRSSSGYDRVSPPVAVAAGQTATLDVALRRDWAAFAGGARIASTNDDTGAPYGCGVTAAIDQSLGRGWSAENHLADADPARRYVPSAVLRLPSAVNIDSYAIDPGNTCGDDATASLKGYRLETSPDGTAWTTSAEGELPAAAAGKLTAIAPSAATSNVLFVRLTLKSPQGTAPGTSGASFIDISELEIYGTPVTAGGSASTPPTPAPAPQEPTPTPAPAPTPTPTPPFPSPAPAAVPRPSFTVPSSATKGRIRVKVTCKITCRAGGTVTVDRATKRRYRLRSNIVGRLTTRSVKGTKTVAITLTADARRRLRARHVKKLRVTVRLAATVTTGLPRPAKTTKAKALTLRL
jgi:extracellular elastinolytic metalloproteinase